MNDDDFRQRAFSNPWDNSNEFVAAIQESPERQQLLDELQAMEKVLHQALDIPAPEALKKRLLDPDFLSVPDSGTSPYDEPASGFSFWTRLMPLAACLVISVFLGVNYWTETSNREFEEEIFSHIYNEIGFLDMNLDIPIPAVNQLMAITNAGGQFSDSNDLSAVDVMMAKDCIFNRAKAVHMVVQGDMGAVTVMVIPSSPVKEEFNISNDRFEGVVTPTPMGNLVVVGEKEEPISEFKNLIANNISWQ